MSCAAVMLSTRARERFLRGCYLISVRLRTMQAKVFPARASIAMRGRLRPVQEVLGGRLDGVPPLTQRTYFLPLKAARWLSEPFSKF